MFTVAWFQVSIVLTVIYAKEERTNNTLVLYINIYKVYMFMFKLYEREEKEIITSLEV